MMLRAATTLTIGAAAVALLLLSCAEPPPLPPHEWTVEEKRAIESLSLARLPELPPDPSNRHGDDPRAAGLGQRLYFDARFSANGEVSCATCHQPDKHFTDGLARAQAIGTTLRHTPTIVGTAYNPWFFWDGRKDSQWSQALAPMEDPVEHGGNRMQYARLIRSYYAREYEALFGALPDLDDRRRFPVSAGPLGGDAERAAWEAMDESDRQAVDRVFANVGKAIAAYERRIMPGPAPFDRYAEALSGGDTEAMRAALTDDQAEGLRLFVGAANCVQCHNGPLFTNHGFHNIGLTPTPGERFDKGRVRGAEEVVADPFNCSSRFSDAAGDCPELRYIKPDGLELVGAFKVPSLRNVAETAPYMHQGQIPTLRGVLAHYNQAPQPQIGHSDLVPLELSDAEIERIIAFLEALTGPIDAPEQLLRPPSAGADTAERFPATGARASR